eukprot:g10753.t1
MASGGAGGSRPSSAVVVPGQQQAQAGGSSSSSSDPLFRWRQIEPSGEVYSPRTGHVVVTWKDRLYVFGGTDGSARQADVHEYNTRTNTWHEIRAHGTAPPARSGAQAVCCDGKVWMFGGYTRKDGDYFNDVFQFQLPQSGIRAKWDSISDTIAGAAPSRRTDHSVVLFGRSMYVFGGFDGRTRFNDLHELKLDDTRWIPISTRTRSPKPRFGHSACVFENSMYVFGGWDGHVTLSELQEYNFATNSWQLVTSNDAASSDVVGGTGSRAYFAATESLAPPGGDNHQNAVSTVGGDNSSGSTSSAPCSFQTIRMVTGPGPSARYRHSAVVLSDSMYVFGGVDKDQRRFNDLHQFDFVDRVWVQVDTHIASVPQQIKPTSRTFHRAAADDVSGNMWILGGFDGNRQNDLHAIKLVPHVNIRRAQPGRGVGRLGGSGGSGGSGALGFSGRSGSGGALASGAGRGAGEVAGQLQNVASGVGDASEVNVESWKETKNKIPLKMKNNKYENEAEALTFGLRIRILFCTAATAFMPEDFWRWQEITDQKGKIYTPRTGHAVVVYGNRFYLMGGTDESARQNDIYQFDVESRTWSMLQEVAGTPPSARSGSKAVVHSDSIYFFGGYTKKDGEYFQDLYSFHIPQSYWRKITPTSGHVPPARTDHSCCNYGPNIYVFGGFDGKSRFDDLQKFSVAENKWEKIRQGDNTPMGRFGHSACMYGPSMFVFGGWNGHDTLDDLTEFSTTTNTWYSVPGRGEVPSSRYRHSAIVYGCCMFVFGGVDKRQARFSDLIEFNFDTRTWSRIRTFGEAPSARTFHKSVIYGGRMFILGGFDGQRKNDMFTIAIIEERTAEEKKALGQGRFRGRAAQDVDGTAPDEMAATDGSKKNAVGGSSPSRGRGAASPGASSSAVALAGLATGPPEFGPNGEKLTPEQVEIAMLKAQITEVERRLAQEEERHICKICFEREVNAVILDCSHFVSCSRCVTQLSQCPICRKDIVKGYMQTFNA